MKALYLALCRRADTIMDALGISEICTTCATKRPYRPWVDHLGCCTDCPHLGKAGCTTQSLACKMWFCRRDLRDRILKSKYRSEWLAMEYMLKHSTFFFGKDADEHRMTVDDLWPGRKI